jgi:hypothetical protein
MRTSWPETGRTYFAQEVALAVTAFRSPLFDISAGPSNAGAGSSLWVGSRPAEQESQTWNDWDRGPSGYCPDRGIAEGRVAMLDTPFGAWEKGSMPRHHGAHHTSNATHRRPYGHAVLYCPTSRPMRGTRTAMAGVAGRHLTLTVGDSARSPMVVGHRPETRHPDDLIAERGGRLSSAGTTGVGKKWCEPLEEVGQSGGQCASSGLICPAHEARSVDVKRRGTNTLDDPSWDLLVSVKTLVASGKNRSKPCALVSRQRQEGSRENGERIGRGRRSACGLSTSHDGAGVCDFGLAGASSGASGRRR